MRGKSAAGPLQLMAFPSCSDLGSCLQHILNEILPHQLMTSKWFPTFPRSRAWSLGWDHGEQGHPDIFCWLAGMLVAAASFLYNPKTDIK